MKILIVDDKKENLYLLETLLRGSGYEVESASNGKEALEKLKADGFDMIIADILMPVMDGFQLCRKVKADNELKNIPFVFYTATYTNGKDEEFALKLGADKFIRKPIEPDEFMKIIQGAIRDVEKGKVKLKEPASEEEEEVFKLYSERLVNKLEKKMLDLEKEITERKRAEEQIKKDLEEKEVILKEIHHRVRNNMQIILSLINLQSRNIKNENVREMFNVCRNRIFSISLIHDKLYSSKDLARIDFNLYIRSLTSYLLQLTRDIASNIKIDIIAKDVFLDINTAIPCGMIINELVSNAFKYAFPKGRKGKVTIEMYKDDEGKYNLIIQDNGIGFPKDLDFRETDSLGLDLVTSLTKQLDGTIELERDGGIVFKLVF